MTPSRSGRDIATVLFCSQFVICSFQSVRNPFLVGSLRRFIMLEMWFSFNLGAPLIVGSTAFIRWYCIRTSFRSGYAPFLAFHAVRYFIMELCKSRLSLSTKILEVKSKSSQSTLSFCSFILLLASLDETSHHTRHVRDARVNKSSDVWSFPTADGLLFQIRLVAFQILVVMRRSFLFDLLQEQWPILKLLVSCVRSLLRQVRRIGNCNVSTENRNYSVVRDVVGEVKHKRLAVVFINATNWRLCRLDSNEETIDASSQLK